MSCSLAAGGKKKHHPDRRASKHSRARVHPKVPNAKGEQLDLSSELAVSKQDLRLEARALRPADSKMSKPKKRTKVRVEGAAPATVQVPDNLQWDHNRQQQENSVRQLEQELERTGGKAGD
jgi:hypothetical protein